jgi:RNA polymerase sigma-70 factor (ECF subfamily)
MGPRPPATEPEPTSSALDPLVARAQGGDERAFERVVRHVYPHVFRWALVQTRSPDDADEVAQRVLIRLHQRISGYAGESRFLTWLYRMTRNVAIDLFRSRSGGVGAETLEERGAEPPSIVDRIEDERLAALVRAFFRELPDRQREIFDLVDLQGMSPAEVAEMLEMNPSTVRANLFKARNTIRGRILDREPTMMEDRRP